MLDKRCGLIPVSFRPFSCREIYGRSSLLKSTKIQSPLQAFFYSLFTTHYSPSPLFVAIEADLAGAELADQQGRAEHGHVLCKHSLLHADHRRIMQGPKGMHH